MITREDIVRIARDTISTSECDNPITFDPPEWAIRAMQRAYEKGRASVVQALTESVKLQSHYATLLNQDDGGTRMTFPDASAWIKRLREVTGGG